MRARLHRINWVSSKLQEKGEHWHKAGIQTNSIKTREDMDFEASLLEIKSHLAILSVVF